MNTHFLDGLLTVVDLVDFVSNKGVISVTKLRLVELIFPLFARVNSVYVGVLSCILLVGDISNVHVPDANDEVFELNIALELLIQVVVEVDEFLLGDFLFAREADL